MLYANARLWSETWQRVAVRKSRTRGTIVMRAVLQTVAVVRNIPPVTRQASDKQWSPLQGYCRYHRYKHPEQIFRNSRLAIISTAPSQDNNLSRPERLKQLGELGKVKYDAGFWMKNLNRRLKIFIKYLEEGKNTIYLHIHLKLKIFEREVYMFRT